jgi:DNA-binding response OmpR family regulator
MKKKILIVEDNADHQFIVKAHLEAENYQVFQAQSALEALEILTWEPIDLIVLDLWLPGLDGMSLLKNLKSHEHWASIPVIVTSGALIEPDDVLPLVRLGVGHYFVKPYEPAQLVEAVENLLVAN